MLVCKRCEGQQFIKKGIVAGKPRYKCKECNLHFREGDKCASSFGAFYTQDKGGIEVRKDGGLFVTNLARRDHDETIRYPTGKLTGIFR